MINTYHRVGNRVKGTGGRIVPLSRAIDNAVVSHLLVYDLRTPARSERSVIDRQSNMVCNRNDKCLSRQVTYDVAGVSTSTQNLCYAYIIGFHYDESEHYFIKTARWPQAQSVMTFCTVIGDEGLLAVLCETAISNSFFASYSPKS
jgi:hypothetical protein